MDHNHVQIEYAVGDTRRPLAAKFALGFAIGGVTFLGLSLSTWAVMALKVRDDSVLYFAAVLAFLLAACVCGFLWLVFTAFSCLVQIMPAHDSIEP